MARTTDMTVAVRGTNVGVRLYEPRSQPGSQPALVYLHGGGWTLFSIATHDRLMRDYAHRGGICVIGVDYSLAHEAPLPRSLGEAVAVGRWLRASPEDRRAGNECGGTCRPRWVRRHLKK